MNQSNNYNDDSTLINAKRVREATGQGKAKDQDQVVVTIGLNSDGTNEVDKFLEAVNKFKGKQINLDIRMSWKEYNGKQYRSAFVVVKEMIPLDDPRSQQRRSGGNRKSGGEAAKRTNAIKASYGG